MGSIMDLCCEKNLSEDYPDMFTDEKEITFRTYSSKNDPLFYKLESKYNFFNDLKLIKYLNYLENFNIATCSRHEEPKVLRTNFSSKDAFLNEEICLNDFQCFIENTILYDKNIVRLHGQDADDCNCFKEVFLNLYTGLKMKLTKYKNNNKSGSSYDITKRILICFGLLYCKDSNISKVKTFYNLFTNDKGEFENSEELEFFLIALFLIPSYCVLDAMYDKKNVGKKYELIETLDKDQVAEIIKFYDSKSTVNLKDIVDNAFFGDSNLTTNYEDFKKKFGGIKESDGSDQNLDIRNNLDWMFNPKGIRYLLDMDLDEKNKP